MVLPYLREQVRETCPVKLDILGMAVTEIDHVSALRSGMELVAGIIVMAVRWGGAADLAGVATGDIISEVDGKPTRTIKDLKDTLAAHEAQTPIRLLFRRVGAWRYLALPYEEESLGREGGSCCC
ncbi:PDZ domain-containing protein [Oryzomonas sagensis]|uniref:PDZ domain-containing protein n=1 Tax=Oryzomonas sagensis TaxID=2603857 RepID=A0ABQ6TNJ6_9BACT|nr:PDZ domain-containing protein [Oryzomonas sagensis]KAB0670204.1 PDZ domain-containing protein [Oryzomonas sagensis]